MSGTQNSDRKTRRRQQAKDEIVAAAWTQAREQGLEGLSMRELGARVGMRAQSLYSYFASKHDIYDAMFRQGNEELLEAVIEDGVTGATEAGAMDAARRGAHRFFDFCVSDPVRYQLLFQRTIVGFAPSDASYAVARAALDAWSELLRTLGVDDSGIDLWTAVLSGLVAQQLANDPGGDRWAVLVDRAVDMLVASTVPAHRQSATTRS